MNVLKLLCSGPDVAVCARCRHARSISPESAGKIQSDTGGLSKKEQQVLTLIRAHSVSPESEKTGKPTSRRAA